MNTKKISIAIDGPSGSGKGTLAKKLANKLGFIYVDTGALYRTIGLDVQRKGIASDDTESIIKNLSQIDINMVNVNSQVQILLDGEPVDDEIRTPTSSIYSSCVSKIPEVRLFLLDLQKNIALKNNVVMDGRDIGTVILPKADLKIFLYADEHDRAQRRYNEFISKGEDVTYEKVLADMRWRDANDKTREIAPAVPAADAVMLDNSGLSLDETFEAALKIVKDRLGL